MMTIQSESLDGSLGKERGSRIASALPTVILLVAAFGAGVGDEVVAQSSSGGSSEDVVTILPGDKRFKTPEFDDYEVVYTSRSSKTGGFTLQARKSGDGKKLSIVDIIPMQNNVIVAQRQIDLKSHRAEFSAGPFFAWGTEFVFGQADNRGYNWTRVPIGQGKPKQMVGEIKNSGYISEMFSPTLASLMPMDVGAKFRVPEAYPRKGDFVSSEFDEYKVLRKERLSLPSGLSCDCWVIEKKTWNGSTERIWVSREAPFVFRRIRDFGGRREFTSDALSFRKLK